jgi:N-acetylmuramoyl-L-alanine amidase
MPINKNLLQSKVQDANKAAQQSYSDVTKQSVVSTTDLTQSTQTNVGAVANQTLGGIQSLASSSSAAVPAKVTVDVAALENSVNDSMNTFASTLTSGGKKITLSYGEDSDGTKILKTVSLDPDPETKTVGEKLSGITGNNIEPGFAHNITTNGTPAGITSSLSKIEGKVGAFSSVSAINELASEAQTVADASYDANDTNIFATAARNQVTAGIADVATLIPTGAGVSNTGLSSTLASITGSAGDLILNSVLGSVASSLQTGSLGSLFKETLNKKLKGNDLGLMQGFLESITSDAKRVLDGLGGDLSDAEKVKVIELSQGSSAEFEQAVDLVAEKTGKSRSEVRASLGELNTTIAGTTVVSISNSAFSDPFSIGREANTWKRGEGSKIFSYVSSYEELEAEMKQASREITEVVTHWTDTYSNKNIGSEELHDMHNALGLNGIAYHYVIRRDGSLQRGRPLKNTGQHAPVNDHDKYSIGIAFVGGYNCPTGTPNPEAYLSAQSLTRSQMNTFEMFCRAFYSSRPGGQILGHNDIDLKENDPGFDVIEYVKTVFNKHSVFTDTLSQGPLSAAELNKSTL